MALVAVVSVVLAATALARNAPAPAVSQATVPSAAVPSQPPAEPERLAVIGDSWVGATGTAGLAATWPRLTAAAQGMRLDVLGQGGTGYTTPSPYVDRVPALAALSPDVVVVQGSINDTQREAVTEEAARAVLSALREQLPTARTYAIGPAATPGGDLAVLSAARDGVAAAARAMGTTFLDPQAETWLPIDEPLWSDPWHLNDAGHRAFADRATERLRP